MARNFVSSSVQSVSQGTTPIANYPFTMAMWIYPTASVTHVVGGFGNDATHYILLLLDAGTTKILFQQQGAGGFQQLETTTTYSLNTWQHIACSCDGSSSQVWLNGGGKNIAGTTLSGIPGINTTIVGGTPGGSFFDGRIADFGVWNIILKDVEISALANGVSANRIRRNAMSLHWPLWGISNPEPDLVGNRNGTVNNGATLANHAPIGTYAPIGFPFSSDKLPNPPGSGQRHHRVARSWFG